ncbi:apolipoprotein C-I-like [Solea senegalensis]|uniref:Apolipoprotein C-I-like n=1 Tax=Solea senegalensis TaxID=28829 RepID=A0AAV6PU43_SOLSE|nr:apolipoprotein C-I-like [Solea senegalensis]
MVSNDDALCFYAKMRLYLAVAVLMLAFVAYTEAQDDTIEERFSAFTDRVAEMSRNLAEKAKANMQEFQSSEFATKAKNWITERVEAVKNSFN